MSGTRGTRAFEGTAQSSASAGAVWAVWTNPADWTGDIIRAAKIDGDFVVGSRITLKPKGLPTTRLTITQIDPQHRWAADSKLPGVTIEFEHIVESGDSGTRLVERGILTGSFAGVAAHLIGHRLEAMFAGLTAQCARQAET